MDRPALRKLLSEVLRSDSDLDAFCSDYFFSAVYKRFTRGMERQEKLTLLLDHADGANILAALRRAHPEAVPASARKPEGPKPAGSPRPASSPVPAGSSAPPAPASSSRPRWILPASAAVLSVFAGVGVALLAIRGCSDRAKQARGSDVPLPTAGKQQPPPPPSGLPSTIAASTPPPAVVPGSRNPPAPDGHPIAASTPPAAVVPGHIALAEVAPMRFVSLPGGTFQMGSPPGEEGREDDETQHQAKVGPFEMAIHEVTQKQWFTVMGTKPFECTFGCSDDLPAQSIIWFEAVNFMNALTDRENAANPERDKRTRCYDESTWTWDRACTGYRLPTEAEWEYAARAGTTTAYSFGNEVRNLCSYANGADQTAKPKHSNLTVADCDDRYADLAPVGMFKANPWGLYDMHGNVREWVWDWYASYPQTAPADYAGPDGGEIRVLRGGGFVTEARWLRSSLRGRLKPTVRLAAIGFRCARGSPPSH